MTTYPCCHHCTHAPRRTDYAGELVIDLPKSDPEYRRVPAAHLVGLHEYRFGHGLTPIINVKSMKLHFSVGEPTTATLEFHGAAPSTWLVAGFREYDPADHKRKCCPDHTKAALEQMREREK